MIEISIQVIDILWKSGIEISIPLSTPFENIATIIRKCMRLAVCFSKQQQLYASRLPHSLVKVTSLN